MWHVCCNYAQLQQQQQPHRGSEHDAGVARAAAWKSALASCAPSSATKEYGIAKWRNEGMEECAIFISLCLHVCLWVCVLATCPSELITRRKDYAGKETDGSADASTKANEAETKRNEEVVEIRVWGNKINKN